MIKISGKKLTALFLSGIILASLAMSIPFLKYGISASEDSLIHFAFAGAIYDSVRQGNIVVDFEPKFNDGYGGYALRFYPIFANYTLAFAYFLTNDWHLAGFLFFWFWMALGGFGVFFLAREWMAEKFAFVASLLYLFEPYHNVQTNLLFAYAEFVAGCLLTFCFLFTVRIFKYGKISDILGFAIFYGLLILTHIPLTLIGTIGLFIFAFLQMFFSAEKKSGSLKFLAGFFAGILAASFYLVRLFSELSWIKHSSSRYLTEGGFSYKSVFVDQRSIFFPGDLVLLNFLILLIPPTILILFKSDKETKRRIYPLFGVTFFSLFMSTSLSNLIWENFIVLQKVQFPWRWLTLTSIGFGLIIASSISPLLKLLDGKKLVPTIWTGFFIVSTLYFTVTSVIGLNLIDPDFFLLKNREFNQSVEKKSHALHDDFWQTIWTKRSAFKIKDKIIANERKFEIKHWGDERKEVSFSDGQPTDARFAVGYYPYWQANVNGEKIEVLYSENGAIVVPISTNAQVIKLEFVEPFFIKLFKYLSAIIWLTMFAALLLNLRGKFPFRHSVT